MRLKLLKRLGIALAIAFGPLAAALTLFVVTTTSGDANGAAGFYLAAAVVVTPFSMIAGGAYFVYADRR